jgi:REP element-mobilizing transposase RayT
MPYYPDKPRRRSIRLQGYDYTQEGAYFVTICSLLRESLFGEINEHGIMVANRIGEIVEEEWTQTAILRPYIELDAFVVMPNHVHSIIVIMSTPNSVGTRHASPLQGRPKGSKRGSLGAVVGSFKSAVTKRINELRDTPGAPVWQRNYYEEIIRNEHMLNSVRQYIETNPTQWALDENNPANLKVPGE